MNFAFYASLGHLPIGVAVTIEFIGPLALAAVLSRRPRDLLAVPAADFQLLRIPEGIDTEAVWSSILENEGSVQHLDALSDDEKAIYKTAFELDQRWVIELAADRTGDICQAQSLNLFIPGDVNKWDLHMLHWSAWERGVKSLYYLRSKSVQRAAFAGAEDKKEEEIDPNQPDLFSMPKTDYAECLACQ